MKVFLAAIFLVYCDAFQRFRGFGDQKKKCEPVKADMCLSRVSRSYNSTQFPNLLKHRSQQEAIDELDYYTPLIKTGCSKNLSTFLCAYYIPLCDESYTLIIPPCQELCFHAKQGCENILKKFGFTWQFDCTKFPKKGAKICVPGEKANDNKKSSHKKNKVRKGWGKASENEILTLKCPKDKQILIRKIRHSKESRCCRKATNAVLSAMCNGKSVCEIVVSPVSLGGHCDGSVGKLSVKHKCVSKVESELICKDDL